MEVQIKMEGIVKNIVSGDTLLIEINGSTLIFTMDFIKAPRLACHPNANIADAPAMSQPWAWEAFEYLLRNCLGRRVIVEVDKNELLKEKQRGTLWIAEGAQMIDVAEVMLMEGLVTLKHNWKGPRYGKLKEIKDMAGETVRLGRPIGDAAATYRWNIADIGQYVARCKANKKVPVSGVVMGVECLTTLFIVLKPEMYYAHVALTGILGPSLEAYGSKDKYLEHARRLINEHFVQREVQVFIEGHRGQLLQATLVCDQAKSLSEAGSIAEFLVGSGAVLVDRGDKLYRFGREKLIKAQGEAVKRKAGFWGAEQMPDTSILKNSVNTGRNAEVSPFHGQVASQHAPASSMPIASAQSELAVLTKEDLVSKRSQTHRQVLQRETEVRCQVAAVKDVTKEGTQAVADPVAIEQQRTKETLFMYLSALHARGLIEEMDRLWKQKYPGRNYPVDRWDRIEILIQEHEAELQAVMINHQQLMPRPVPRLLAVLKKLYRICSDEIHSLELLAGRALINGDQFGENNAKVLMALSTCLGVRFQYYRNGVFVNSWKEVTVDGLPYFGTEESDDPLL